MVTTEPATEQELIARARALSGRTVGELAEAQGVAVPGEMRRAKGLVGGLVERALGASAGNRSAPDFPALGIELKTLPLGRDGRPRESTFVCTIALDAMAEMEWESSPVRAKLARVLFMPVEAEPELPLSSRRLGTPLLWSPSPAQEAMLESDWDELAGRIGMGQVEGVTGHLGQALQVRPKGAHGRQRRRAPGDDGAWVRTMPRGFYLRATFTASIVRDALPG